MKLIRHATQRDRFGHRAVAGELVLGFWLHYTIQSSIKSEQW